MEYFCKCHSTLTLDFLFFHTVCRKYFVKSIWWFIIENRKSWFHIHFIFFHSTLFKQHFFAKFPWNRISFTHSVEFAEIYSHHSPQKSCETNVWNQGWIDFTNLKFSVSFRIFWQIWRKNGNWKKKTFRSLIHTVWKNEKFTATQIFSVKSIYSKVL